MLFPAWAFSSPNSPVAPERDQAFTKYVEIPGAEKVGAKQCSGCHEEIFKTFRRATHSMQDLDCEDCHGAGSLHASGEEKYGKIVKFKGLKAENSNGVCLGCHSGSQHLQNWMSGRHQARDVRCVDCHRIHAKEAVLETRSQQNQRCVACHRKQAAEGNLPYHHPVREAKMGCADCHDPHGGTAANNLRADSLNDLCFQCHAEFQGPFAFQHAPVVESCAKCHASHGSMHRNMLKVSEPMLCLQCHSAHHNGTTISLLNRCTSCHSSIHGSDVPSATGGSIFIDK